MSSQKVPFIIFGVCIFVALGVTIMFSNGVFKQDKPLTETECIEFAKKVELSIVKNDPSFLNNALNHHSFLKKVVRNSGSYNKTQLAVLADQVKENIRFGDMVMRYLKSNDGYFNFTKLYYKNDIPHIIFRIYSQMEGLNYFDCELERSNGKINISDVFIYFTGEKWSTSYSRHMKLMGEYNKGSFENILPENEFHNSLLKLDYISELLFTDEVEQAELIYSSIPNQFKKDKIFQGTALKIALQKNDSIYITAIDECLSFDPKNEAFNRFFNVLRSLAAYENSKAREAISELNELTGEDTLMQLFIGQTFQNEKKYQRSITYFNNVIDNYPDLFETYWYKIVSLIQSKQYQKAADFLDITLVNFEARKMDLEDLLVEYPDFINSKEYLSWRNLINI